MRLNKMALAGIVVAILPFGLGQVVSVAEPATGAILGAGSPTAVPGSYIVALKDASTQSATSLVSTYGGTATHVYRSAFKGFAVRMAEEDAKALAADPAVAYVQQDRRVAAYGDPESAATRDNAEWGLDRIDQRRPERDGKYHFVDKGAGVRIYVIDSGVRTSHNEFDGPWGTNRATAPIDYVDDDADGNDCNGHGTHVAGTAAGQTYGVAPAARIIGLRVLDCHGEGQSSDVIAALDHVRTQGVRPAVVNMSMGGGADIAVDSATQNVIDAGFAVVAAAGNSGADAVVTSPARVAAAITVAASDPDDRRPYWSNHGSLVDLHAPGVGITSAWHTGDAATATKNGTSMAAPHVAGVIARFLQHHPDRSPSDVAFALRRNAIGNAITDVTPAPPGWSPGNPGNDPDDPPPTESGTPIGVAATTEMLLHASISGQPDTTCPVMKTSSGGVIPDYPAAPLVKSWTIAGCGGVGIWGPMSIEFDISHPRPSDLLIDLVGPSGTRYRLREPGAGGSVTGITIWRAVNQSRDGVWRFEVQDFGAGQTGYLNGVTIRF